MASAEEQLRTKLEAAFKETDTDKSGRISHAELKNALKKAGFEPSDADIEVNFFRSDLFRRASLLWLCSSSRGGWRLALWRTKVTELCSKLVQPTNPPTEILQKSRVVKFYGFFTFTRLDGIATCDLILVFCSSRRLCQFEFYLWEPD